MSRENVELVLGLYRAVERGDYQTPFEAWHERAVWDMTRFELPDLAKVYHGHDGIREFWRSWLAAWESLEFRQLDAEDRGDHVVVEVEQRNRGRASGAMVDFHHFQVFAVREGKITACVVARTKAEARAAVGL